MMGTNEMINIGTDYKERKMAKEIKTIGIGNDHAAPEMKFEI